MPSTDPSTPAREREDDALRQQLPHQPAAAGADRGAQRNLPLPAGCAHEQQVGDVRARDQEDEADGAEQHVQRRADVGDERFAEELRRETVVGRERRKLLAEDLGRRLQLGLRLLERHPWHQLRRDLEIVSLVAGVRIELERDPDVRVGEELLEIRRAIDHADDRVRYAAQRHHPTEHVRIAVEAPRPGLEAQDDGALAIRAILVLVEGPPHEHPRAEEAEEVARHAARAQLLRKRRRRCS